MEFPLTQLPVLDLAELIRPGDTVLVGQATGEPRTLTELLVKQRSVLERIEVFLGAMFSDTFQPEHADHLSFTGIGGMGTNAALARAGVLDILPCHVSALPALIETGRLPVDVVLVQLAPADSDGLHSLGTVGDYLEPAIAKARTVIAEINDQVPHTAGPGAVHPRRLDAAVHTSRAPVALASQPPAVIEQAIADLIEPMIPDGAVLQLGVGRVPQAVAASLSAKHDLSVHSGIVGDWIVDLHEAGVVTNVRKPIDTGLTVTGGLFGTSKLFHFADRNPAIEIRPLSYTHHPAILSQLGGLIAINSAVEVDLSGQVNAETVSGVHIGAVGGQVDFARAAMSTPGGRSILAFCSTAQHGTVSRIVPTLHDTVVTTARSDVDVIVTEHGIADLRGLSVHRRAERLVAIAHPDFQNELKFRLARRRTFV